MTYEKIHACTKGRVLFRKEYTEGKYCSNVCTEEATRYPRDNPTPPSVHTEDTTSIHDRGIRETDDMAQKRQIIES
jgi:hypothetical protein